MVLLFFLLNLFLNNAIYFMTMFINKIIESRKVNKKPTNFLIVYRVGVEVIFNMCHLEISNIYYRK